MKILGQNSVAHNIQTLLGFFLYMQIGAALISAVFFIMAISSGDEGGLLSTWPVTVYPPVESPYSTVATHPHIFEPDIRINEGTIQFSSREVGYYLLKAIDGVLVFAYLIYITYLLREIFRTLSSHQPFTTINVRRLRIIALLVLLVVPYQILRSIAYYSYIKNNIRITGGEWINWGGFFGLEAKGNILLTLDVDMGALFTGVLLLIITEIFRIGTALQEDKESII